MSALEAPRQRDHMSKREISLNSLLLTLLKHRSLIRQLVAREFVQRYRGSLLGLVWAILTPLITVAMFTFLFGVVFPTRWTTGPTTTQDFAIVFLCGLMVHAIFAEAISRAPSLITGNSSYVKRVIFPLEILPFVTVASATINAGIGLAIVVIAQLLHNHELHLTLLWLPVVIIPYLLLVSGLVIFTSALGVYLRDIQQFVALIVTATLFMTPIFYPIEAVPAAFRPLLYWSPLTFIVENVRRIILFGNTPDFIGLCIYSVIAVIVLWGGFIWFQKTRSGFADVI